MQRPDLLLMSRLGRSLRVPAYGLGLGVLGAAGALTRERVRAGREQSARRRSDLRARAAELLGAPLDLDALLEQITGLLVPDLGELVVVDLLDDEGGLRAPVVRGVEAQHAERIRDLRRRFPLDTAGEHPIAVVLRTHEPQLLAAVPEALLERAATSAEHLELLRAGRYRSALLVPLVARGRSFGVLSCRRIVDHRPYDAEDLRLAQDLAARAALALDNARLFDELRVTESRLEAIVSNLGEAVVAHAPDGTILFANDAAAEVAGQARGTDMAGRHADDLLPGFRAVDEHGERVDRERFPLFRALAGEDPEPLVLRVADAATGRTRWWMTRAERVLDETGALHLVVNVVEDVTAVKEQEAGQRLLAEASKLLTASLDVATTLDRAAWAAVPALADWARIDLAGKHGRLEEAAVAHRDLERVEPLRRMRARYPPDPAAPSGPAEVLRTGLSQLYEEFEPPARDAQHQRLLEEVGTRSLLIVPLVAGDRTLGTMELATTAASGRRLGQRDVPLAEELARRAAIAVENARVHAARTHIATTLQRWLLPPRLPVIPGITIAARFRAAEAAQEVGGDFYDLFPARSGWMVVMGDVSGKGPGAAAITSLARYTMRTAATYEDDPRRIVERLNETLAADADRRQICTAICMALRHDDRRTVLEVTCAGHPPPLLITADGNVRPLGQPGTLLGAFPSGAWSREDVFLGAGDAVVLYTDGVTDTRGPAGRFGDERLEALLREIGPLEPDEIAHRIDLALQAFGEQRDDVALLVLRAEPHAAGGAAALAAA